VAQQKALNLFDCAPHKALSERCKLITISSIAVSNSIVLNTLFRKTKRKKVITQILTQGESKIKTVLYYAEHAFFRLYHETQSGRNWRYCFMANYATIYLFIQK
jgi:hypothetical protein